MSAAVLFVGYIDLTGTAVSFTCKSTVAITCRCSEATACLFFRLVAPEDPRSKVYGGHAALQPFLASTYFRQAAADVAEENANDTTE